MSITTGELLYIYAYTRKNDENIQIPHEKKTYLYNYNNERYAFCN
jgi:hypothetical protein